MRERKLEKDLKRRRKKKSSEEREDDLQKIAEQQHKTEQSKRNQDLVSHYE